MEVLEEDTGWKKNSSLCYGHTPTTFVVMDLISQSPIYLSISKLETKYIKEK